MGVYVFDWKTLKEYLQADDKDPGSENDFGKNIIPSMLAAGEKLYAYEYGGYWKDVGTVQSLWEANMELLSDVPPLNLYDEPWRIFSRNPNAPPHFVDEEAKISNSLICEGCQVYGTVENSILSTGVIIEKGASVYDSVVMEATKICAGAQIDMAIIDEDSVIGEGSIVGSAHDPQKENKEIAVIGRGVDIAPGSAVPAGTEVRNDS